MLMAVLLAIWNGPFYIGPLTRPVSVGDVLMKVLETGWRLLIVVVLLGGIALAVALIVTERSNRADQALRDGISTIVAVDEVCPETAPVLITVSNSSPHTLRADRIIISGVWEFASGRSPLTLSYSDSRAEMPFDVPANQTLTFCHRLPVPADALPFLRLEGEVDWPRRAD